MSYSPASVKNAIADKFFTTTDYHGGTLKLGLLTAQTTEATWTSYARQTIATTEDNAGTYTLKNATTATDPIDFPAVDAANGSETITHWGLFDTNDLLVYSQTLNTNLVLAEGNVARFPVDSLTLAFG